MDSTHGTQAGPGSDPASPWDARAARWQADPRARQGLASASLGRAHAPRGRTVTRLPVLKRTEPAPPDPDREFAAFIGWWVRFESKGPDFDGQCPESVRAWMLDLVDAVITARVWVRARRARMEETTNPRPTAKAPTLLFESSGLLDAEQPGESARRPSDEPDFTPVALEALRALAELAGESLPGVPSNLPKFARAVSGFIEGKLIGAVERAIAPARLATLRGGEQVDSIQHPLHGRSMSWPTAPSLAERALRLLIANPKQWFTVGQARAALEQGKRNASVSNTIGNALPALAKRLGPLGSGEAGTGHVARRRSEGSMAMEYRWVSATSVDDAAQSET